MTRYFTICYEITTPESAARNDNAAAGVIAREIHFRDAIARFEDERSSAICEADQYPVIAPREFRDFGAFNRRDSEERTVSLQLPDHLTPATRRRIARVVGCYGAP